MKTLEETKLYKNWKRLLEYREQRVLGLKIGYKCLDDYLLGLGNTVGIQADTGLNKSTLAAQIIRYNALIGIPCILIDRENGPGRIQSRLLCQHNHISETIVMSASIEQLKKYRKAIYDLPIHVHTESIGSSEILGQRIEELFKMYNSDKAILTIDSFQALDRIAKDERVSLEAWSYYFDALKLKYGGRLTIININEKKQAAYGKDELGTGKGSNVVDYKNETILNISATKNNQLAIKIIKNRDGITGGRFLFDRELMDHTNPRSFTFNLIPVEDIEL